MLRSNLATDMRDEGEVIAPNDHFSDPVAIHPIPLLDLNKIAEMEALIGHQAVANMFNMISTEIVDNIPIMIDDLASGKFAQARKAAHRLRGASSILGVTRLADGLGQIEKIADEGENILYVVNHLRQVATDTLRAIADRNA